MAKFNPSRVFQPAVEKEFGAEHVIIAKQAKGGEPIRRWYKKWKSDVPLSEEHAREKPADGLLYGELMTKVTEAVGDKEPTPITFIWMQGESDAGSGHHAVYEESLKGLVQQLRDDLKFQNINVVIGRISDARMSIPSWMAIRKIQEDLCAADPRWEMVSTDDLNDGKGTKGRNRVHYNNPEGYDELGKRYAEKAIKLVGRR